MAIRKMVSLLLSMTYILIFIMESSVYVSADEEALPTYKVIEKVDGKGNVVVTVCFTETDKIGSGNYRLEYEKSVFELKSAVVGSAKADSKQINAENEGVVIGNFYYRNGFVGKTTDIAVITLKLRNGSFSKNDIRILSFEFSDVTGYRQISNHTMTDAEYEIDCPHKSRKMTVEKEATCTKKGEKVFECTVCMTIQTEIIPATGHHYDNGVVTKSPTYTEKGIRKFTCTDCGKSYTEEIPMLEYLFTYQKSESGIMITGYKGKENSIAIPESINGEKVTAIGDEAFRGCFFEKITVPKTVIKIGKCAFINCSNLKEIKVDTDNGKYCSDNGILFDKNKKTIIRYPEAKNDTVYTIPNSVTTIGQYAFSDCIKLKNIALPNSVTKISSKAFAGCNNLVAIYYKGTAKQWRAITVVSDNAKLTEVTVYTEDTVTFDNTAINLGVGQNFTLKAVTDTALSLTWKSSNTAVATVSSEGKVSAKSAGTADITVTLINGKSAKCRITVQNAPTTVSLNKSNIVVGLGEVFVFTATVGNGEFLGKITYTSKNTDVVTVDTDGTMTTKSVGSSVITAQTYNGKKATCRVTVKKAPTSISINRKHSIVGLGETFYLEGSLSDDEAARVLTFSSNHPEIATVTDGGIVMAKSKGTAIVSITTYNGQRTSCRVTVKNAPTSLTFNQTELTLKIGKTFYLESKFNDGEYARMTTYNSPNKTVATISGSGVIMAKRVGTVNITGKTYNGQTAVCTVTVVP